MKKLNCTLKIIIVCLGLIFVSCDSEHDHDELENHAHEKSPHEVSLDFFKKATKIDNVDYFLKQKMTKSQAQSRLANYTLSDFIIDTTLINQHILNSKNSSFSFRIHPTQEVEQPNKVYNLVVSKIDNQWETSIFLLTKNSTITNGKLFSSIKEVYKSVGLPSTISARIISGFAETTTFHCTNTGECARTGICDRCKDCVTTTIDYVVVEGPQDNANDNFQDPSFLFNDGGGGGYAILNNFISSLSQAEQDIYYANPSMQEYLLSQLIQDPLVINDPLLGGNTNATIINPEAIEIVKELIGLVIEHNIEFIDDYQGDYNDFENLSEVENFLTYEEVDNTISNSINFQQDKKLCNRTIKLNQLTDLLIELVITPNPNFSLDQDNSKTDIDTLFPGLDWVQQSITITDSNASGYNNFAEITISGYILVGIKIGDLNKGIKLRKHIIIRVDKNDGRIFGTEVKNIN